MASQTAWCPAPVSSYARIVASNVFTVFNGILFAVAVVVLAAGYAGDAVFGFVAVLDTLIGVLTEIRAKRAVDRLSILTRFRPAVRRQGRGVVDQRDLVLGDLL